MRESAEDGRDDGRRAEPEPEAVPRFGRLLVVLLLVILLIVGITFASEAWLA